MREDKKTIVVYVLLLIVIGALHTQINKNILRNTINDTLDSRQETQYTEPKTTPSQTAINIIP